MLYISKKKRKIKRIKIIKGKTLEIRFYVEAKLAQDGLKSLPHGSFKTIASPKQHTNAELPVRTVSPVVVYVNQ